MQLLPALTLALSYTWGGPAALEVGAGVYGMSCRTHTTAEAFPVVLTWTPADGFGARSDVSVTQFDSHMVWCY